MWELVGGCEIRLDWVGSREFERMEKVRSER